MGAEMKCKACSVLAQSISRVLQEERERPGQDYQRNGKLIKYDKSEAMALAVLEPQCPMFGNYALKLQVKGEHNSKLTAQEDLIRQSMRNWCERTLEEHEDEIVASMFRWAMMPQRFQQWLCEEAVQVCGDRTGYKADATISKLAKAGAQVVLDSHKVKQEKEQLMKRIAELEAFASTMSDPQLRQTAEKHLADLKSAALAKKLQQSDSRDETEL